jgi:hypothetical protein
LGTNETLGEHHVTDLKHAHDLDRRWLKKAVALDLLIKRRLSVYVKRPGDEPFNVVSKAGHQMHASLLLSIPANDRERPRAGERLPAKE